MAFGAEYADRAAAVGLSRDMQDHIVAFVDLRINQFADGELGLRTVSARTEAIEQRMGLVLVDGQSLTETLNTQRAAIDQQRATIEAKLKELDAKLGIEFGRIESEVAKLNSHAERVARDQQEHAESVTKGQKEIV